MTPQNCTQRLSLDKRLLNCLSWRFIVVRQTQILQSLLNSNGHSSENQYCFQSDTSRPFRAAHHFSRSILDFYRERIFFAAGRPMSFRRFEIRRGVLADIVVFVQQELYSRWSCLQVAKEFFLAFLTIKRSSDSVVCLDIHIVFFERTCFTVSVPEVSCCVGICQAKLFGYLQKGKFLLEFPSRALFACFKIANEQERIQNRKWEAWKRLDFSPHSVVPLLCWSSLRPLFLGGLLVDTELQ